MKKTGLLKLLSFAVCLLLHSFAFGQNVANVNCPNPAGGCDTIAIEKKVSPWRVGGFIGPAVAFCGKWSSTFNSDKYRDKSLFNGIGFHAGLNADYFFNVEKKKQLKFGVGAVAGLQMFFLRNDLDTFLDQIIAGSGSNKAVIRKGSSEDHYLAVGPVLSYAFGKKPRSPFIEASVRGGLFRTTPAAIFVYDEATSNNIYSVTATDKRYHAGLLATLGLFFPSKKGLWSWGVEAAGFRTKVNYIFPGATIYSYQRKHGGFTAGLAFRRNFVRDIPVPKAPTPPLICEAPDLEVMMNGKSIKGMMFSSLDSAKVDSINISWRSRSASDTATTESFTARLHHLDGAGKDSVIAEILCKKETRLAWPAAYRDAVTGRPVTGQYTVTVQSQRISNCASCVSLASVTGFAVKGDTLPPPPCPDTCACVQKVSITAIREVTKDYRVWSKSTSPDCTNCICPAGTETKTKKYSIALYANKLENCEDLATIEFVKNQFIAPKWVRVITLSIETTSLGEGCKEQGNKTKTYKLKIGKDRKIIWPQK